MVTGDHYLTATSVAQYTGMLDYKRRHVLISQPEAVFIRESAGHSSLTTSSGIPLDRYGQPLRTKSAASMPLQSTTVFRTKSAIPADFASSLAEFAAVRGNPNRSKSLNKVDALKTKTQLTEPSRPGLSSKTQLTEVSRTGLSSKPLVAKPPLPLPATSRVGLPATAKPLSPQLTTVQPSAATKPQASKELSGGVTQPMATSQPAQLELHSASGLMHARSSEPYMFDKLLSKDSTTRSDASGLDQLSQFDSAEDQQDEPKDALNFVAAEEGNIFPMTQQDGLAFIAEGHQCIINGAGTFEYLLDYAEPAVLHSILRNVAVCARMRSHHKAQLVQLLGAQGLSVSGTRYLKVCVSIMSTHAGFVLRVPTQRTCVCVPRWVTFLDSQLHCCMLCYCDDLGWSLCNRRQCKP